MELLYAPFEAVDESLTELFAGAPLALAVLVALLLGLRHAADPDHLVAVTALVAERDGDVRSAVRVGAWWGIGHSATLLVIGVPLIMFKANIPSWLASLAEKGVGIIIVLLALRVLKKWVGGGYRVGRHEHHPHTHYHVHRTSAHGHPGGRTSAQSFAIGVLHGLGGTAAVVLLLVAAMPHQLEAAAALAVFAPTSIISMALCTGVFSWALTRPVLDPIYRSVIVPGLGAFGLVFGAWYIGIV